MCMDDIKLFAKKKMIGNPKTVSEIIQSRYKNGIWHRTCPMLIMKSGKRQMMEGIELHNQEKIRTLGEKETYKYLRIFEADIFKHAKMNNKKSNASGERESFSKLNYIKEINTWGVPLVRYSGPFWKWTGEELLKIDQRTRKLMTMHPRDDVHRLYVPRKEGGRGHSIEESVEEDWLQPPETIPTIQASTEQN